MDLYGTHSVTKCGYICAVFLFHVESTVSAVHQMAGFSAAAGSAIFDTTSLYTLSTRSYYRGNTSLYTVYVANKAHCAMTYSEVCALFKK